MQTPSSTQGFEDRKSHSPLITRSSTYWKNIGGRKLPKDVGLQSFTIITACWRCRTLLENRPKEKVEIAAMKANQLITLILSHIYGLPIYSIIPYSSPFTSLLFSIFFESRPNMRSLFQFKTSTIQFSTRSRLVPCVSVTIQSLILKCIRIITRLLYTCLFGLWFLRLRLLLIYWERKIMLYD